MELGPLVVASAQSLYHRFQASPSAGSVDETLLCFTVLYLAAKSEESSRDLRDVITTGCRWLHPTRPALEVDET